ncbi:hypothetical protein LCGC14_0298330 [marine sediment metagenome]|uniref:Uncharacterized protein n=1 Tax=marine sediment metagenome TaxID=412755 RepID=A0A0F9WX52_9ZZZZ
MDEKVLAWMNSLPDYSNWAWECPSRYGKHHELRTEDGVYTVSGYCCTTPAGAISFISNEPGSTPERIA